MDRIFKFFFGLCLACCVIGCNPKKPITGFQLTAQEIHNFQNHSSDLRITLEELERWDGIVRELIKQNSVKRSGDGFRLYAYLYCAQKAFADASFEITNAYSGSIDLISLDILKLFYPNYQNKNIKKDSFSIELTTILMTQIEKRYREEERNIHSIKLSKKEGYWKGEDPADRYIPTMQPWTLQKADEFKSEKPPSPNDPFWDRQQKEVETLSENATDLQKQRAFFWEKLIDPEESDWRFIAERYMKENAIPFEMQLEVRQKLTMALMDALIAVFHDKFTYFVQRPFMRNSSLKPLFPTPNHPSYPAAHATISSAAETILSYYFPENQMEWSHLASESRISRLWAGIHFPIDLKAGQEQGKQIGNTVLFRQ